MSDWLIGATPKLEAELLTGDTVTVEIRDVNDVVVPLVSNAASESGSPGIYTISIQFVTPITDGKNHYKAIFTGSHQTILHPFNWDEDRSHFNGVVYFDAGSAFSGTTFPNGTYYQPVNNPADTRSIANRLNFTKIIVKGTYTLDQNYDNWNFEGHSSADFDIIDLNSFSVNDTAMTRIGISGAGTGEIHAYQCEIKIVSGIYGDFELSLLEGSITLGAGNTNFLLCCSPTAGAGTPYIDIGGIGRNLGLRGYAGGIEIRNLADAGDNVSLDMLSGQVVLAASCTAGTIIIRGITKITDNSLGASVDTETALSRSPIADVVLDELLSGHTTPGSLSKAIADIEIDATAIKAKTDNLPADPASETNVNANETKIDLIQVDTTAIIAHLVAIKGAGWVDENLTTIDSIVDAILADTNTLEADLKTYMDTKESNIRGADSDDLKVLSDQLDVVQTDLDNPNQYKADVSALATTAHLTTVEGKIDTIDTNVDTIVLKLPVNNIADQTLIDADLTTIENKIDIIDTIVDSIKAITDNIPADLTTELQKIRGLLRVNSVLELTFDGSGNNTSSILYTYNNSVNASANDHVTGLLEQVDMTSIFSGSRPTEIKVLLA